MEQNVVILVKSNPEESHRPVEAIRIGLGLLSGDHKVSVILLDKAPLLLGDKAEDLVDGEDLGKFLPPYRELEQTFYVEKEALNRANLTESDYSITPISMEEVSNMIAQADRHLIF
jgi:sulfur relay (sulfurtransferase) DsrF/TusC family protein